MKVIFLDIDGVLNVETYIVAFWDFCKIRELKRPEAKVDANQIIRDGYGNRFCPTAVSQLKRIIDQTGAKIVISSTWRMNGLGEMQSMWKDRNLPGDVIDVTPVHIDRKKDHLSFEEAAEKGGEIHEWLRKNKVTSYVIFDDDNDMLKEQRPFFIQTNPIYGLTNIDANNAIELLNKKEDNK